MRKQSQDNCSQALLWYQKKGKNMFWSVIVALTVISGTKFLDLDNDELLQ